MKKVLPYLLTGLGLAFVIISMILRQGTADAHTAVTNVASSFMIIAGGICILAGLVTFFLRDDPEIW